MQKTKQAKEKKQNKKAYLAPSFAELVLENKKPQKMGVALTKLSNYVKPAFRALDEAPEGFVHSAKSTEANYVKPSFHKFKKVLNVYSYF